MFTSIERFEQTDILHSQDNYKLTKSEGWTFGNTLEKAIKEKCPVIVETPYMYYLKGNGKNYTGLKTMVNEKKGNHQRATLFLIQFTN